MSVDTLATVQTAMTALWKLAGENVPRNWGIYPGIAPQKTPPLFATYNIVPPGNVIMSMGPSDGGTNIDDFRVQVNCFADQRQGMAMAYALGQYADSLWHRQPLTMTNVNLVGMYRISTIPAYWVEVEKLWQVVKTYRVMAG